MHSQNKDIINLGEDIVCLQWAGATYIFLHSKPSLLLPKKIINFLLLLLC